MISQSLVDPNLLRGYKIRIYPTEEQIQKLDRFIDLYRYVYNWGLDEQNKIYESGGKYIRLIDMFKLFKDYRNAEGNEWLKDIPLSTARCALMDLDTAFMKFFRKITRYPVFKSKKTCKKSFTVRRDRFAVYGNYISIEGMGRGNHIYCANHHIPDSEYYHPTITYDGIHYYLSVLVVKDSLPTFKDTDMTDIPVSESIGIDVGKRHLMITSDGEFYDLPDTSKLDRRLSRMERKVAKDRKKLLAISKRTKTKYEDVPKTKNMQKRTRKLRSLYKRKSNIINTFIHTATKGIVMRNPSAIVIEDISVRRVMDDNPYLKKYSPQMMWYTTHMQLQYKAEDRGIPVIKAPREYPSTQLCSCCGSIKKMGSQKVYICPVCGLRIDRDLNAAYNLRDLAY